jgi:hypothetical protein
MQRAETTRQNSKWTLKTNKKKIKKYQRDQGLNGILLSTKAATHQHQSFLEP